MKFGDHLKVARLAKNLTQEQVAHEFMLSRQTISNWENEKSYPDIASLIKLSDYYQISLDELLKEDTGMRENLEKQEVVNNLRPIKRNLLMVNSIIMIFLIASLFDFIKLDTHINYSLLLVLTSFISLTITDLNKFDHESKLGLEYHWQKFLTMPKMMKALTFIATLGILFSLDLFFMRQITNAVKMLGVSMGILTGLLIKMYADKK
ncbi:helix-turn-helix transcriptional regulator [Lactobacillus sp. ESL0791]|uniref:helix-turn-helix domain-containing protein n=1 Tax=Lactobacillus sp. ESL0791 TaxID=2983234 RepID=UPI0023F7C02A|nr:helix-turn-helix transcriptional regulator [Lactobacillus sp. ESL0791]MDF7639610.1 helix-turn-helix transcriptional regulator [Lactobacillus sp. ESL0791]